jgi:hypothetical protein
MEVTSRQLIVLVGTSSPRGYAITAAQNLQHIFNIFAKILLHQWGNLKI